MSGLQVEEVVRSSGLPWSMLRATQFYDFVYTGILGSARLPVVFAPRGFRVQPVDPRDVAERLAGVALADPAGHVTDMAGPAVTTWADMVREYLDVSGRRKPLVQLPVPGLSAIRDGALLPGEGAEHRERTWRQFLEERRP